MNPSSLRQIQEPLKQRYKAEPAAALVTLRAVSRTGDGITCKVETGRALVEAGLHPATGGSGAEACSGDMLLEALAACAGVTLRAVATSIDFALDDATIFVEGDIDFRGTLSVDRTAPVGFTDIRLRFSLKTLETDERVSTLIRLTERYCVVLQTLRNANDVRVSVGL